tara:strand:+ start:10148 stop:10792 length:645 start_codon:yes stop_codon:yes gene_type:complete
MKYHPKSQIQTNLFTDGEEFSLSTTGEVYTGYYYKISNNSQFTGKSPSNGSSIRLVNIIDLSNEGHDGLHENPQEVDTTVFYPNNTTSNHLFLPQYNTPLPTPDDYKREIFTRYFCKKSNENKYLEIDQKTYDKLISRDSSILWSLYTPFSLQWKISPNESANSLYNQSSIFKTLNSGDYKGFSSYIISTTQYTPTTEEPSQQSNSNSSTGGGY